MRTFAEAPESTLEYWLGTDAPPWHFHIYTSRARTTSRDVTGYTTSFLVKRSLSDSDGAALLTLAGSVTGSFNSDPAVNTQRIAVAPVGSNTDTEIDAGAAYWALKRTDTGNEAILCWGTIYLRRAVHVG